MSWKDLNKNLFGKYNLIDNYIYIYHLNKFCVIPVYPESISDSTGSSYASSTALTRSAPVFTYQNSGPRSISFKFNFHRDLMEDVNTGVSNLKADVARDLQKADYLDILIRYLQACALPKYTHYTSGSKSVEPPQVAVRIGNDIFIKGVVDGGVTVDYGKPILDDNRYAVVGVSFTVKESDPYDALTVSQVGSFRGITSTFKNGIYNGKEDSFVYTLKDYTGGGSGGDGGDAGRRGQYDEDGGPIAQIYVPGRRNDLHLWEDLKHGGPTRTADSQFKDTSPGPYLEDYRYSNWPYPMDPEATYTHSKESSQPEGQSGPYIY